jgi:hypothetical protein
VAGIANPKVIWKRMLNLLTHLDTSSTQWKIKSNSRHLEMTFLGWPPSLPFPSLAILDSTWQQVVSNGFSALPNSLFFQFREACMMCLIQFCPQVVPEKKFCCWKIGSGWLVVWLTHLFCSRVPSVVKLECSMVRDVSWLLPWFKLSNSSLY